MSEAVQAAREFGARARVARTHADHAAAAAHLREAIERLETAIAECRDERASAGADESALAAELADLYGMLGGTLREADRLVDAALAYDAGYRVEADPRYGFADTYNALNRLTTRVLADPPALSEARSLPGAAGEPVDVSHELGLLRARLAGEVVGPRASDAWAAGDFALVAALLGDAEAAADAAAHYERLDPAPRARRGYRDVVARLAALDTPRRDLLTRLCDALA